MLSSNAVPPHGVAPLRERFRWTKKIPCMNEANREYISWLALAIGNSRLHWAQFTGSTLKGFWDTPHLPAFVVEQLIESNFETNVWLEQIPNLLETKIFPVNTTVPALWIASVVPDQLKLWQTYPNTHTITLNNLPLLGVYPTLGIDRALAVCGAGNQLGWPVLVIDAGTALTFTGADQCRQLVGGAILPGLGLQLQSLSQKTAALPLVNAASEAALPPRWALNTPDAIQSGIIYSLLAGICDFIEDWCRQFPDSFIALTGGDSQVLFSYLQIFSREIATKIIVDPHLIFWGIREQVFAETQSLQDENIRG